MAEQRQCDNFIGGVFVAPAGGEYMDVTSPADGSVCAKVAVSGTADVDAAVTAAKKALPQWKGLTIKSRAACMFKLHHLVQEHALELATLCTLENGKTIAESLAEVAKGNETIEWACSLPQLAQGNILQVSRGVMCHDENEPLGVVGCIVPFNFPFMVPCWTTPIALTMGNAVVLKTSEKAPMAMTRFAELVKEAGVPDGVFSIVHGTVDAVNAVCDHEDICAVSFVGSSRVARIVHQRCSALGKRVLALGGAKNHLVALPDCDVAMTAADIVSSFCGCAGQRCMAASVLLTVTAQPGLLDEVVAKASELTAGQGAGNLGPVIDEASQKRILSYIEEAEAGGAKILLDGRSWQSAQPKGTWLGPTVILHTKKTDRALQDEIFGPVLSVLEVPDRETAIAIENAHPAGNAASVYTNSGAAADWFSHHFRASQIGVNVGVAVPREPFSFGGMYGTISKFGEHDITGTGAMNFFSQKRKITTKWSKFDMGDAAQFK
ncbi:Aldehyde dehydrogenase [Hondaea fermentalgiana]|uniref:Aldehyde dehydrogenase n=1 Tax=Hondaea fermentalgiana TaxID=2315210 RepID=A0A2R5GX48_9STRA|nr:Aldehyde dehydrogenase [Hondaea fermentalgiana]|eukprot:GBG33263.1 Aldehyde dehydrogenase [Hondaea fermentalgiana]